MSNIKVNDTPVRTCKSFNINNIAISNVEPVKDIVEFNNVEVLGNSTKVQIEEIKTPINLKYGLGEDLTNELNKYSNQNYKITVDSKTNKETRFNFNFDKNNTVLIENVDVIANEGTNSTFILKYESEKDLKSYHNGIIKLNAKAKSNVNIIIINLLSDISNNFITIDNV
ncbi:MAG: hypothetical protein J6N78_06395, partial [Clostridia bacterium]|nr:hypothetical protein [Clostridia bacterium]